MNVKIKFEGLQDKASLIQRRMVYVVDLLEWIELNEEISVIYREIDVLSCLMDQNEILHI